MARLRPQASLALFAAALPALAAAQADAPPAPFGEDIEVVGQRQRPTAAADPTAAATVVDATRFAGEAKSVAELVATAPGVAVNGYGGLGQLATVSIRGSTADQVQVFLDGLPLNTAAGGGVDLSRIPREWIERIEVVRGAEGAIFGAGALGGALNIVTRRATGSGWSAEASGGSFRTGSAALQGSVASERGGALAVLSADASGGRYAYDLDRTPNFSRGTETLYRVNNAFYSGGLLAKGWSHLGDGLLEGTVQLSLGRREIPGTAFATTPTDAQRDRRAAGTVRYAAPVAEDLRASFGATFGANGLDLAAPGIGGRSVQREAGGEATARLEWLSGQHALAATALAGAERLASSGAGTHARPHLALAVSDDVALEGGRLRFGPAVRAERVGSFAGFSGKLGATARLGGAWSARASAGRTFRAPSFDELFLQQGIAAPNPNLRPEEGWSGDAALVVDGSLGMASAGAFGTWYRDVIVYVPSLGRVKPFNAGEALARGAELEIASAPLGPAALSGQLAYTFLVAETLSGGPFDVGHDLPHRARHRGFARVAAAPGRFEAHTELQYVGAQWNDVRNEQRIPPALLLGAGASARLLDRPALHVHVEVKNLLDDRSLDDGFLNPLPGRIVMVTLRAGGKDHDP